VWEISVPKKRMKNSSDIKRESGRERQFKERFPLY